MRNVTLAGLIDEAGSALGDLAMWPESESTRERADNMIKLLRKTFKEDSYPRAFLYLGMLQIAHDIWSNTVNREVKNSGLQGAWMKLGEMLGEVK